jgi:hypothetical protein
MHVFIALFGMTHFMIQLCLELEIGFPHPILPCTLETSARRTVHWIRDIGKIKYT